MLPFSVRPSGHGLALFRGVVQRELSPTAQRHRHHLRAVTGGPRLPVARDRDRGVEFGLSINYI